MRSLELVLIGDGATPEVRAAVEPLFSDERVRFIESPKSSSRAELVRHQILADAGSTYVCYLGDDDIMLPDHLATTVDRLRNVDFTHPLPVFVDRDGTLQVHPTDLSDPRCREWHRHPAHNAVSLTGVGHRLDAYRSLPHGWRETPAGRWSDHYMWQQWFATAGYRYATGDRLTVLKFEGSVRGDMSAAKRRAEIMSWLSRSQQPGFDDWLTDRACAAYRQAAAQLRLAVDEQAERLATERNLWSERNKQLAEQRDQLAAAEQDANSRADLADRRDVESQALLRAMQATRTWRIHDQLARSPTLRWLARTSHRKQAKR